MLQNVFSVAISADFLSAFAALPKAQRRKVSNFVKKFRENPGASSIDYESIREWRDKNLRSVRIGDDYRGVVLRPEKGNVYVLLWWTITTRRIVGRRTNCARSIPSSVAFKSSTLPPPKRQ